MAKKITKKDMKKLRKKNKHLKKMVTTLVNQRNELKHINNTIFGTAAGIVSPLMEEKGPKPDIGYTIPCIWPDTFLHNATDDYETVSFMLRLRDYTGMTVQKGIKVTPEDKNKCAFEIVGFDPGKFDDVCIMDKDDSIVVIIERIIRSIIDEYVDTSYFNIHGNRCFEIRKLKIFNKLFEHAEYINTPLTVEDIADKDDRYATKAVTLIAPPSKEDEENMQREIVSTKYYLYDFQVIKTKPVDILLEEVDDPDDDIFTDNSDEEDIDEFVNEDCSPSDDEEYYPEGDELFDEDIAEDESVKETNIPEEEASNDH